MIDENGKIKFNSGSLENLALEPLRIQRKRLNVTVLPSTSNWLKHQGNASKLIDDGGSGDRWRPQASRPSLGETRRADSR